MLAISLPVNDVAQIKLMMQTWYLYLSGEFKSGKLSDEQLTASLSTPLIYSEQNDALELNFTGSRELLDQFQKAVSDALAGVV